MTRHPIKAVILDMDGVITRTAAVHARAWKELFDEFLKGRATDNGSPFRPFDLVRDYAVFVDGKPRHDGIRSFLKSRGIQVPEETVISLGERKNRIFHRMLEAEGVEVFEDTREQLHEWKRRGLKVAVISSSRNCEAILIAAKLINAFDAKVDGNDLGRLGLKGKPDPAIFVEAAEELGVEPTAAMVVEDAIAGVRAAAAGSFGRVIGVARDHDGRALWRAGADRVVRDLRELDAPDGGGLPSALACFHEIAASLEDCVPALFFDYDGTLTPIVRRPEEATLDERMRSRLAALAERCTVAIVSGRGLSDVCDMVGLGDLIYAGSHGFDIQGPNGLRMQQEAARHAMPTLDAAERELRCLEDEVKGVRVERKTFAIAIHYREVTGAEDPARVEAAVDRVVSAHAGLRKRGGKKIFEIQPDVPWDKGRAVMWLLDVLGLHDAGAFSIYIGDDVTDEDAFSCLREHGVGIGIRVGEDGGETAAHYGLRDCREVAEFLAALAEINKPPGQ